MLEVREYQLNQRPEDTKLIIELPIFGKDSFSNKEYLLPIMPAYFKNEIADSRSELKCTAASLRGHIVNAHFSPLILSDIGVARYDIDLAAYRGFNLNWVVKQAYKRLEESPEMIERRFKVCRIAWITMPMKRRYFEYGDIEGYKKMLAKTLKHIDEQGLAPVDWNRAALSVPSLEEITLDIDRDSRERPFRESVRFPVFK